VADDVPKVEVAGSSPVPRSRSQQIGVVPSASVRASTDRETAEWLRQTPALAPLLRMRLSSACSYASAKNTAFGRSDRLPRRSRTTSSLPSAHGRCHRARFRIACGASRPGRAGCASAVGPSETGPRTCRRRAPPPD
jgi:hypothetical protein